MSHAHELLSAARDAVIRTQNPSIAALQAKLRIGHSAASKLISELEREGILLAPFPGRARGLNPDWRRVYVQSNLGDLRLNHFDQVAQLALFYFELAEEDANAHSKLARPQVSWRGIKWREVQHLFRSTWYGQQSLSLTDAALALNAWLADRGIAEAARPEAIESIRARCRDYERPFHSVNDPVQRLDRLYVRMARFFRRTVREDLSYHSRIAEYFVGNDLAPHSAPVPGYHAEHVVPCAVIRDIAIECFKEFWSVMQVAALMKRLLVVAHIPMAAKDLLDKGQNCLQHRMPDQAWDPVQSCIYARLHAKNIDVPVIPSHPCTCTY